MKFLQYGLIALSLIALATMPGLGQGNAKGKGKAAPPPMSFFITSVGMGDGANLGGIAAADAHCQMLAEAAGSTGMTWHAFLSTQTAEGGGPAEEAGQFSLQQEANAKGKGKGKGKGRAAAINARDRIGQGPWYNAKGQVIAQNLQHLLGDTIDYGRQGNFLHKLSGLNEKGEMMNGVGDQPNRHDIMTGSQLDGTAFNDGMDHTCSNYTSNSADGSVQLGHFDRLGGGSSWVSAHPSRGCSQENLVATGGNGYFYCFAVTGE
jgi:hypothetical protein